MRQSCVLERNTNVEWDDWIQSKSFVDAVLVIVSEDVYTFIVKRLTVMYGPTTFIISARIFLTTSGFVDNS